MRKKSFSILILSLIMIQGASAYIDPGTGGMIIGSIWPFIIGILAAITGFFGRYLIKPLKKALRKTKKKIKKQSLKTKIIITTSLIIALIIIIALARGQSASNEKMTETKYNKVLLLGIDGMEPKIVDKLIEEGKMPNFEKLAKQGTYKRLNTSHPPHSPVAWTSISTGTNPGKHNIFDFIMRDERSYMPELSLSKTINGLRGTSYQTTIKQDTYWKIISEEDQKVSVIRWPMAFPPIEVEGNLLAGLGVPDIKGFLSGYTYYQEEALTKEDKKTAKTTRVFKTDDEIKTWIKGPRITKSGEPTEITTEMTINTNKESAEIEVNGNKHKVMIGEWSEWMEVKFKKDMFSKVSGIFKAYIVSTEPFEMYITSIQINPTNPIIDISAPSKYAGRLAKDIGQNYFTLGIPEETDGYVDEKIDREAFLKHTAEIEAERDAMFWKEFEKFQKEKKGVLGFVYDTSDRIQHMFWENKNLDESQDYKISLEIEEYYLGKDKLVEEILTRIDDKTLLLIISDHGFTSFERAFSMNRWLVENKYMSLTQEPKEGEEGGLFKYVDWKNTKAYAAGFNSLYINLKGREGKGIVSPKEKEELEKEIIKKLESMKDKKNGYKPINKVYKAEEIYNGDNINNAPDMQIGFNPGYRMAWQTAVGGLTNEIIFENEKKWKGDHLIDPRFVPGVIFSNEKLINIEGESADQKDITPTMLKAIGLEVPKEMDGVSLIK